MNLKLTIIVLLFVNVIFSQIGINTESPNDAAAIELNSSLNLGFGGLKLPTVTKDQKVNVAVTPGSDGMILLIDYGNSRCLEIYDGIQNVWQKINCLNLDPVVLYSEDFESYVDGTGINSSGVSGDYPSSVSRWILNDVNGSLAPSDYVEIQSGVLEANDTNGPIQFDTQSIDITGYSNISFSLDISGSGTLEYDPSLHATDDTNAINDYVNVSYSVDNGPFVTITDFNGNGNANHTLLPYYLSGSSASAPYFPNDTVVFTGLSGSSLVIRVQFQNWAGDEFFYIDNIEVLGN